MKKSEFLLQIRKKYKMSRAKFAEYLGVVSASSIEKIEREIIPITPENKYVKAVCALEGLDNEIFKFDEITDDILKEYELTKFSKAFRKFLFFYYGSFYPTNIIAKFINTYTNFVNEVALKFEMENFSLEAEFYGGSWIEYVKRNFMLDENLNDLIYKLTLPKSKQYEDENILIFLEAILICTINSFDEKFQFSLNNFNENYHIYFEKFKEKSFIDYLQENFKIFLIKEFDNLLLLQTLEKYENTNLILSIENIKKLKKIMTIKEIQTEQAIKEAINYFNNLEKNTTDPKDKEICELLQYAPPAFKDKIIEKLKKFRDEVEDI